MNKTATNDEQLNEMIQQGKLLEAFDQFYADEIVMEEPTGRREGKKANREYEEQFVGSVEQVHNVELLSSAVTGDTSFGEWIIDVTFNDGNRVKMEQVSRRRWKDGKVVREDFYYDAP